MAAKDGFFLVLRNPLRFGVVQSIGAIFILFGKIAVASGATLIGYIIIKTAYDEKVYSPLVPSLVYLALV